jgi:predicted ferric reductase
MNKASRIFLFVYGFLILFFAASVLKNVFSAISLSKTYSLSLVVLNSLQRLSGVVLLLLLFVQIIIGAYRPKLSSILGSWVMNFHIWQGRAIYALVLVHTFSLLLFNFLAEKGFNPFYVFIDLCLICKPKTELFYSFGRFGFWILTLTVLAALLRSKPWWKENWRYFHYLNYPLFFLISLHAFFLGSDFSPKSGYLFYFLCLFFLIVLLILFQKIASWFKSSFRWK